MLDNLQALLTIVATATGIYVAVGGLNAWRRETTGKRDIELCQAVIEKFYEAEYKMKILRSPFSRGGEGGSRKREEGESESEAERRDILFVPLARYNDQFEFWAELMSFRFRMRALFGKEADDAFGPIDDAIRSFRASASTRYQMLYGDPQGLSMSSRKDFEKDIWEGASQPDAIAAQMKEAIERMEAICVPIVRATRPTARFREWWNKNMPF